MVIKKKENCHIPFIVLRFVAFVAESPYEQAGPETNVVHWGGKSVRLTYAAHHHIINKLITKQK